MAPSQTVDPPDVETTSGDDALLSNYLHEQSHEALSAIVDRYSALVASVCRSTLTDAHAAEDAFQMTFVVFMQSADKIRESTSLAAWLHGVAYRISMRLRKREAREASMRDEIHSANPNTLQANAAELAEHQEELSILHAEIQRLPAATRSVLLEFHFQGQAIREIAAQQGISESAVDGRLRRGRKVLRKRLARSGIASALLIADSHTARRAIAHPDNFAWSCSFKESIEVNQDDGLPVLDALNTLSSTVALPIIQKEILMLATAKTKFIALAALGSMLLGVVTWGGIALYAQTAADPFADGSTLITSTLPQTATVQPQPNDGQPQSRQRRSQASRSGGRGVENTATVAGAPWWLQNELPAAQGVHQLEVKIRRALTKPVDVNYPEQTLNTVLQSLADQGDIPVWLNADELEGFGVDVDSKVSLDLPAQVNLRSALRMILRPLGLTYVYRNSVLEITSVEDAMADNSTQSYDLRFIMDELDVKDASEITKVIQETVVPDTWSIFKGPSTIVIVGHRIVVCAPQPIHEKVVELLSKLVVESQADR